MSDLTCPKCGAYRYTKDRYCAQCGYEYLMPSVRPHVEQDTQWHAGWAIAAGIAGFMITIAILLIMRHQHPGKLYDDQGNVYPVYEDEWNDCRDRGLFESTDCWDALALKAKTEQPWYIKNYFWVSIAVGVVAMVVALLMIIASRQ